MLNNLLYLLIGASLGFVAGWSLRTMRYARRASIEAHEAVRKVDEMIERDEDDSGTIGFQSVALAAAVLLTAAAAVLSGVAAQRSADATDRVENLAVCTQDILTDTVRALNQRTELSGKQARARREVLDSQRTLVNGLLAPGSTDTDLIVLAQRYRDAVATQLDVDARSQTRRDNNPYPSVAEIRKCD